MKKIYTKPICNIHLIRIENSISVSSQNFLLDGPSNPIQMEELEEEKKEEQWEFGPY